MKVVVEGVDPLKGEEAVVEEVGPLTEVVVEEVMVNLSLVEEVEAVREVQDSASSEEVVEEEVTQATELYLY